MVSQRAAISRRAARRLTGWKWLWRRAVYVPRHSWRVREHRGAVNASAVLPARDGNGDPAPVPPIDGCLGSFSSTSPIDAYARSSTTRRPIRRSFPQVFPCRNAKTLMERVGFEPRYAFNVHTPKRAPWPLVISLRAEKWKMQMQGESSILNPAFCILFSFRAPARVKAERGGFEPPIPVKV